MSNSSTVRNKAIVIEAFEPLYNGRDNLAAERFWSPNYMQAQGREELNLVCSPPETPQHENHAIAPRALDTIFTKSRK
jgi:hypothetical protein